VWDDDGNLIAATITLGKNLDKGFPDPVYYPVMNSLATYDGLYNVDGDILASTKIIHELGHVNSTAAMNAKLFQRQNKLMAVVQHYLSKKRIRHNGSEAGGSRGRTRWEADRDMGRPRVQQRSECDAISARAHAGRIVFLFGLQPNETQHF
jgi:hypothetical protein